MAQENDEKLMEDLGFRRGAALWQCEQQFYAFLKCVRENPNVGASDIQWLRDKLREWDRALATFSQKEAA